MKEKYIEIPNLPQGEVALAVVDGRINNEIEYKLNSMGIKLIKTFKNKYLYDAISYHPDVIMHHLGNEKIVVAPNVDEKFLYLLEEEGFKIILGKTPLESIYPKNIAYNVARLKDKAILNIKYTDEILLEELHKLNLDFINVKQGYAKCSICVVDENSILTSDNGIHKIAIKNSIDSLLLEQGHIYLFELNYGFIGGSSGFVSKNKISFFGNLTKHPNYKIIMDFLNKKQKKPINLYDGRIIDYGTLIPLKEYSIL